MRFGRIGGMLVVGGCVLFMVAGAIAAGGGAIGLGLDNGGGLVLTVALALLGSGAAVLSVAGPTPLHGGLIRIGLGTLAVGLVSTLAASGSPLDSPVAYLFIVGMTAAVLGSLVTVLSLVRTPGPSRAVGLLFPVGILLLLFTVILDRTPGAMPLLIGGTLILLGGIGVGVLAIAGDRSASVASA